MTKKAIIFHGTGCAPDDFWYPWLKIQLEARGYAVSVPSYPDMNRVPIADFLPQILAGNSFDADTVLIGHSAGSPLILSILEQIQQPVVQAILVAGFSVPSDKFKSPILQSVYDWEKIRHNAKDIITINSDNDPWGCDDIQGRRLFDALGGTLIIRHDGHFGSANHNQPYRTFPLLARVIA